MPDPKKRRKRKKTTSLDNCQSCGQEMPETDLVVAHDEDGMSFRVCPDCKQDVEDGVEEV